jgi:hypothetical protein
VTLSPDLEIISENETYNLRDFVPLVDFPLDALFNRPPLAIYQGVSKKNHSFLDRQQALVLVCVRRIL